MSEWIRWGFAVFFFAAGFISIAAAVFGVFRFRFVLNRMQAAAIIDTFGILFITLGLILMAWDMSFVPKLLLILLFQWIGSPIASHMVGRMEVRTEKNLKKYMEIRRSLPETAAESIDQSAHTEIRPEFSAGSPECAEEKEGRE